MKAVKIFFFAAFALSFFITKAQIHNNRMQGCKNLILTQGTFPETVNRQNAIQLELGNDYSVGDWNDLKAIPNIEEWIACVGLHNEQSFLVTRDGNPVYGGRRHYMAQYFAAGEAPANFLIHDRIGNKLYLGSWYGVTTNILAIKHESHRMEHEIAIREHENRMICKDLKLSQSTFPETVNLQNAIQLEMGNDYSVGDWADLKAIPNIEEWIACVGLHNEQSFLVTRDGNPVYSGKRHYIAQYFAAGEAPGNFLIHDRIGNKLYLGSWYGVTTNILAVKHDTHRMEHNNAILEHDNRIPDCKGLLLTAGSFRETVNLQNTILKELGNKYSVADWADLKAIPNIDEWIACIGLQSEQSFLVTRNGNPIYKGKRHYIAQYFPSGYAPENFLVHDKIGNKLYLGSWFGITTNILAVKHDAHRMRH